MSAVADAVVRGVESAGVLDSFGITTVDVPAVDWLHALRVATDAGATYLDLLTAYDELDAGFAVVVHVSTPDARDHVLLRTRVPRDEPRLASATAVLPAADWHERETHDMYGVVFEGHPHLEPLLLADGRDLRPLRKEVVLAARVSRPWPGAKDPADSTGRVRRKQLPPGVPVELTGGEELA